MHQMHTEASILPTGEEVTWEQVREAWANDVLSARAHHGIDAAGPDQWTSEEYNGGCLLDAKWRRISALGSQIEQNIYIVNESGWREEFGTDLRVVSVAKVLATTQTPLKHHGERIMRIVDAITRSNIPPEIILISPSESEPAVIADGNHRAAALCFTARLWKHGAYFGVNSDIANYTFYKSIEKMRV